MTSSFKQSGRSLYGFLTRQNSASSHDAREDRTEDIRQAMIDSLGADGGRLHPVVVRRIMASLDANGLWYLRSPLMAAMCNVHGEQEARRRIESLSAMFEGLLPQGLGSRPTPLGH